MSIPALPTVWNVYNLRGSPFFQDTLVQKHDHRSLDLFVGRQAELDSLRRYLHGRDGTRQALGGVSGVGKTTLVQMLKVQAVADHYFATETLVPFMTGDTPETFFGRVLGAVYETILANRPMSGGNPAMQAAQQMVRAARLPTGGGGLSLFGFGSSFAKGVTLTAPKDILIDGPRVLRDLLTMIRETGEVRGLLLHLNNLENLTTGDLAVAADVLLSLRDNLLMQEGLHVILVGTTDAVNDVVNKYPQIRNVFRTPVHLQPLDLPEVHELLRVRYHHWRLDRKRAASPPVEPAAIDRLFEAFQGDLRGLLKALDDGAEECIGLRHPIASAASPSSVPPVALAELAEALQARYYALMHSELAEPRVGPLEQWLRHDPAAVVTQKELMSLWSLSQGGVSQVLSALVGAGYVFAHPRKGKGAIQYGLSGKSRLIGGIVG